MTDFEMNPHADWNPLAINKSLLDEFAMAALMGRLADVNGPRKSDFANPDDAAKSRAEAAYADARAMLDQRQKEDRWF